MSNHALPSLSFEQIKGDLNQIGHHLLQSTTALFPDTPPTVEQRALKRLNDTIKGYRQQYLEKARTHYPASSAVDEPQALADALNKQLQELDATLPVATQALKTFMTYEAGFNTLENEARQSIADRQLHPDEGLMLERTRSHPDLRPGLYALTFTYQDLCVELAGAFVATQKNTPVASALTDTQDVGAVLLFTPHRGVESFASLPALNDWLLEQMNHTSAAMDYRALLPVRYQTLSGSGIWPLALSPIVDKPLFEHTFDAMIAKRTLDIEWALSLQDGQPKDPASLTGALDRAISDALPDLDARLALRAQTQFERQLQYSAPDWYRSANETQRAALAEQLTRYNDARLVLLDLLGPAASPQALARHQWLERLDDDLAIEDLDPERLSVTTLRNVPGVGDYSQTRNLIELALTGLHTGDETPGSEFLSRTTLTYNDACLPPSWQALTPAWLGQQLATLQPRIDYATVQSEAHKQQDIATAIETLIDRRIDALAWVAVMRGHLRETDWQLLQDLRSRNSETLDAGTVAIHGAQLQDVWILRQTTPAGAITRLLLCTPDAPQEQQFQAFENERDCRRHILGWTLPPSEGAASTNMADYLISQVALRFRQPLRQILTNTGLKPGDQEPPQIRFNIASSHLACLESMSAHLLATRTDDYNFQTPAWLRSTSTANRRKLLTLTHDAEGALLTYRRHPSSEANVPGFDTYLHQQASLSLNTLLGRPQNDVDPDTVWAFAPPSLFTRTPAPLNYTRLYRNGYADGIGFLDEKFSRSATFKGPAGIDLSRLSAEAVARSITGVWIGQRYINKIKAELLDSHHAAYSYRRNATLAITQQQMRSAALQSRLQGHIASLDLQWLEHCIADLGDTSSSMRYRYAVHRLLLDGDWVMDAFLFRHTDHPTLLYTPNAPDGVSFREARLFNFMLKSQPAMIEYFTDRVDVRSRTRVRQFLQNARSLLPADLNRTSVSPARYDSTRNVQPILDLRRALYDMKVQRKIDDVSATTNSRLQMITDIVWTCVEWVTAIVTAPFPVLSLSTGMLLAFKDSMLALHAYNQGDSDAALGHLAGYLFNSAGAIATDLRPVLRSLRPVDQLSRVPACGTGHRQTMKLIRQLAPESVPAERMQPVFFNGQTLWAPLTPDAIGRYLLHRFDPLSKKMISTTRLAAPNADGVWKRTGVIGGAPSYQKLPATPQSLIEYEMPAGYWRELEIVLDVDFRARIEKDAIELGVPPLAPLMTAAKELRSIRAAYLLKVEQLNRDAQRFYQQLSPKPPRVPPRPLATRPTFAEWLDSDAFTGNEHLFIGASPRSIAGKTALIDNLDLLVEKGFKRLYLEYLPADVFRLKLDKMNKGQSWKHIEKHLVAIDKAFGLNEHPQHSYLALVRKAREKGMRVMGLDASTSYLLEDVMRMADTPPTTPRDNIARDFYSHRLITIDSADAPDERWIALVETSRLTTFNGRPGLADLQNTPALRVTDVTADLPVGITVDSPGGIVGDPLARADFHLALQTPYKAPEPALNAASSSTALTHEFEIPPALRAEIERQSMTPHGLDSRYHTNSPQGSPAYDTFMELRTRLNTKAEEFFTRHVPPARPKLPTLALDIRPDAFFKAVGESALSGLVLGEVHSQQSCKILLMAQMKRLKAHGFNTLYVEHLCSDLHQADLDTFLRTQKMPRRLKDYLLIQDRGHTPRYRGENTYFDVYQAAAKYGIRIKALDSAVSYNLKGMADKAARYKMFNYLATRIIEADQSAHGAHKWVAFVGNSHINNFRGVPGLAEMLGGVGLNVRDVAVPQGRWIRPGTWEPLLNETGVPALRGDFDLDMAIVGKATPAPLPATDTSRLTGEGHFLIDQPSRHEVRLMHRSRTGDIITTPIQIDDNGFYFVDRWGKKDRHFPLLDDLTQMLEDDVGLTLAP